MNWIIVPVRNGLHLTRAAMKDFLAQDIGGVRVLVIDNASTDGTAQWLTALDERVHTIHNDPPRSVAASWNQGLRWVFGEPGEAGAWALVVNNDVRLRPDTYRQLLADGGGFVTAVGTDDPKKIGLESSDPNVRCFIYYPPDPSAKRPHPDFSCFLIRKSVYETTGPFNEQFTGAYCEDADYHLRLHRAGIDACCLDLPFLHYGAQTIKLAFGSGLDTEIKQQADRNRVLFRELHGVEVGSAEYYALFGHEVQAN
jgi:GT2 family glycosyltransferase